MGLCILVSRIPKDNRRIASKKATCWCCVKAFSIVDTCDFAWCRECYDVKEKEWTEKDGPAAGKRRRSSGGISMEVGVELKRGNCGAHTL